MAEDAQPLTEYLYRLSLEDPRHMGMFIGYPLEEGAPHPNLGTLNTFVTGLSRAGLSDRAWFGQTDRCWFGQTDRPWFGQADRG